MGDPVDLVIHVGTGKAGTTSIQQFMNWNREAVAAAGHLYPRTPGGARHAKLTLAVKPPAELAEDPTWQHVRAQDPQAFRRRVRRRLRREIDESGLARVVLSEETLFGSSEDTLAGLRRFTRPFRRSLRTVAYLRRQDDHLVSRYQQGVKIGEVRRIGDPTLHADYSTTNDYAHRLAVLARVLEPEELVVRRFEREAFHGGSIYVDFLDAVGIDLDVTGARIPEDRNVSLDAESVEFLRLLNLHRVRHEGATARLIDNRDLVRRLAAVGSGPTLTLPAAVLDDFMARWEDGNREVARRHLGDRDGVLFRTPRKTAGTTTEQRLDPARLDHFLEVAEVPEAWHPALRELVRAEADRG